MEIVLLIVFLCSTFLLKPFFRLIFTDPILTSVPSNFKIWAYSIGASILLTLALLFTEINRSSLSEFFTLLCFSIVIGPAISQPVSYTSDEIPNLEERIWSKLQQKIAGAFFIKIIAVVIAFLGSLIWVHLWIILLAIVGQGLNIGRGGTIVNYLTDKPSFKMNFPFAQEKKRQSLYLKYIIIPSTSFLVWVIGAGFIIIQLIEINPYNWYGYTGLAIGVILSSFFE